MGIISKGILGGFLGIVSIMLGCNWKGIDYMRSNGVNHQSGPSTKQEAQREKFALVSKFTKSMKDLLQISFRDFAYRMTGTNSAFSFIIKNALVGVYAVFRINYKPVLVARGNMNTLIGANVNTNCRECDTNWRE